MEVIHEWYEELPDQCPPSDSFSVEGFVCYRLCESPEPTEKDFLSHRKLFPNKVFNSPECRARAISVFKHSEDLDPLLKLKIHKHKAKIKITLRGEDGLAMKTGKASHYSWWRSKGFSMPSVAEVGQ